MFGMFFELFADAGAKERGPELGPSLIEPFQGPARPERPGASRIARTQRPFSVISEITG